MQQMGKLEKECADLSQMVRLALSGSPDDVRLFAARLVRQYRKNNTALANELEEHLRHSKARSTHTRKTANEETSTDWGNFTHPPASPLLKNHTGDTATYKLLLQPPTIASLNQIISEHQNSQRLEKAGLAPVKSAIFVGPPGVGKTLSALWLSEQLDLPLLTLDLAAVMSSHLGQTGNNLKAALAEAKQQPCLLLLDEVDAIAKQRGDTEDIGELKRLVTVMLQELDDWPHTSILIAATNHPELIDKAVWRRFDIRVPFELPSRREVKLAVEMHLAKAHRRLIKWAPIFELLFLGHSYSDIERELVRIMKADILDKEGSLSIINSIVQERAVLLSHKERIQLATRLSDTELFSQHQVSKLTEVSRPTIRKHTKETERS